MSIRRRRVHGIATLWVLTAVLVGWHLGSGRVSARSTTAQQAQIAVAGWLADNPTPLGVRPGQNIGGTDTFTDERGRDLYHLVHLDPTGWVIVPADDAAEPILAFAATAADELSPTDPLTTLVQRDLRVRLESSGADNEAAAQLKIQGTAQSQAKWRYLMNRAGTGSAELRLLGLTTISDVRVEPLLRTKWSQTSACGQPCYNYYTPSGYPCGCVATALAQLLYYYRSPLDGIGRRECDIEREGVPRSAYTRGGNGAGGPYRWDDMVLDPNCSTTASQREAIGALCYDAGVALNMDYAPGGSAADAFAIPDALKKVFGFSHAVRGASNGDDEIGAGLVAMLNPNLDAGCPAILGIIDDEGHAVVADGYGYDVGRVTTMYHHLNMGWAGTSDLWYNLPDVASFDTVTACIYNIFLADKGEIVSGRVTDTRGRPLADVVVEAMQRHPFAEATSNANGIYALVGMPSGAAFTVSAEKPGLIFAMQPIQTSVSGDWSSSSGNRWNINFVGTVVADYDSDADVDFGDFAVIASTWRHMTDDAAPDPALETAPVDYRPLAELIGNWLTGTRAGLSESKL